MPGTNNEKYITEAWIENGKEEEFKKAFLEALMAEWQGEGNGFDADMLDGKHYSDILKDINSATEDLAPSFNIGGVTFDKENVENREKNMKVGFDAINLYVKKPDGSSYENDEVFFPNFTELPWTPSPDYKPNPNYTEKNWDLLRGQYDGPNLLEVFEQVYDITEGKVDWDTFNAMEEKVDKANDMSDALAPNVKILYDADNNIIGSEINAASVNGIYIYIVGKQEYEELPDDVKNDIHNLFIVKENENGFDDFLKAKQPGTVAFSKYYKFRIDPEPRPYVDPDTGETRMVRWLQYCHQDLEIWHDMAPASDFVDTDSISGILISLLRDSSNYLLNAVSLTNSLKRVEIKDESEFPLAKYIRNNGIKAAISTKYKKNPDDPNELPITQSRDGQLRYLQLDDFGDAILSKIDLSEIEGEISSLSNDFNNLIKNNGRIFNNEKNIASNTSQIQTLSNQLQGISSQLSNLQTKINSLGDWVDITQNLSSAQKGRIWVNKALRLATFRWSGGYKITSTGSFSINDIPEEYAPGNTIVGSLTVGDYGGRLLIYGKNHAKFPRQVWAHFDKTSTKEAIIGGNLIWFY